MTNSTQLLHQSCASLVRTLERRSDADTQDLLDTALDIEFMINGRGDYIGARLLVTFGGPNIWIDTRFNRIEGYWGADQIHLRFSDGNDLDELLEDAFTMTAMAA